MFDACWGPRWLQKRMPVANHATGMLQRFKVVSTGTLLFQPPNGPFDHATLLWVVVIVDTVLTHGVCGRFLGLIELRFRDADGTLQGSCR